MHYFVTVVVFLEVRVMTLQKTKDYKGAEMSQFSNISGNTSYSAVSQRIILINTYTCKKVTYSCNESIKMYLFYFYFLSCHVLIECLDYKL